MGRKSNLFKKTLNTKYFGRKSTFFDDTVSKPNNMHKNKCDYQYPVISDNSITEWFLQSK
ncbi:hypothetical protein [Clostridium estertheticum]|uniref:hypothetical protein n=1 Tax=Clostridium estertheticum TaxID=238834 RepID=UPI001C0C2964|nr:hypothetical protein [Clostridium estertheticum]MBU3076047.1 hypothetical protein [Clostridium estertheticum]MBU3166167.1 hypothetical protein [Clostridium estertheticum]